MRNLLPHGIPNEHCGARCSGASCSQAVSQLGQRSHAALRQHHHLERPSCPRLQAYRLLNARLGIVPSILQLRRCCFSALRLVQACPGGRQSRPQRCWTRPSLQAWLSVTATQLVAPRTPASQRICLRATLVAAAAVAASACSAHCSPSTCRARKNADQPAHHASQSDADMKVEDDVSRIQTSRLRGAE